ncbi:MAG: alpha-galactosidase, partial [Actinomycetota bacterium]
LGGPVSGATAVVRSDGAIEVTASFDDVAAVGLRRTIRVLPGVAALRMQTLLDARSPVPFPLTAYTLDRFFDLDGPSQLFGTINFNGGADWHDEFDYRRDGGGLTFDDNAEWMNSGDQSFAMLMQRRDYLSSRMRWSSLNGFASAAVDLSYDGLYLGPIEPYVVPNPAPVPLRARLALPGRTLALEPVVVAMGNGLADLQWQAHRMLMSDRSDYPNTVNFNTDRVHTPGVDVGARDGVNRAVFDALLPIARSMGVETFILDDGWQKYNGDWAPDVQRYVQGLEPVRDALEANGMRLGLWMAPGSFHPSSNAFAAHPEWTCLPTGAGTAAYNAADPQNGSNAAGIGLWNFSAPSASDDGRYRDDMRADIRRLTAELRVAEFKFDFLVWVDCAGTVPQTIYDSHDAFAEEIDGLSAAHRTVGFGMDETNDFRGFPFESILRGATWFQNGNPQPYQLLHNLWTLQPYVPGFAIGQAVTIRNNHEAADIDERLAVALGSHITFWTDIRELAGNATVRDRIRLWTDFFKQHRALNGFSYPLLADPLDGQTWSGLQPWNPDANSGYAMLYRFEAPNATQSVQMRAREGDTYRITDITPTGTPFVVGDFTATDAGLTIDMTIPEEHGVRILRIDPL